MNIQVIVATHKPYAMPADDMYLPLHVGAEGKEPIGFTGDNTGDHISEKNATFCELTGLYWARTAFCPKSASITSRPCILTTPTPATWSLWI